MKPSHLRLIMHLGGLSVAAILWVLLPFSPLVNAAIAGTFWLVDGAMAEFLFSVRATTAEKISDLRDRVDNPPS